LKLITNVQSKQEFALAERDERRCSHGDHQINMFYDLKTTTTSDKENADLQAPERENQDLKVLGPIILNIS
jgi:hypothetical protein